MSFNCNGIIPFRNRFAGWACPRRSRRDAGCWTAPGSARTSWRVLESENEISESASDRIRDSTCRQRFWNFNFYYYHCSFLDIPGLFFFVFVFSVQWQLTMLKKLPQWRDSNHGPLVSEATASPTEPHHCPIIIVLCNESFCKGSLWYYLCFAAFCIQRLP